MWWGLQYFQRQSLCTFPQVWILSFLVLLAWLIAALPFHLRVDTNGHPVSTGCLQMLHYRGTSTAVIKVKSYMHSNLERKWHTNNSSKEKESSIHATKVTLLYSIRGCLQSNFFLNNVIVILTPSPHNFTHWGEGELSKPKEYCPNQGSIIYFITHSQ